MAPLGLHGTANRNIKNPVVDRFVGNVCRNARPARDAGGVIKKPVSVLLVGFGASKAIENDKAQSSEGQSSWEGPHREPESHYCRQR